MAEDARDESPEPGSWRAWHDEHTPIRLGISSCLLGEAVRFDGGHKRDRFLTDELGPFVEWVPVCPEVEVGLGVPRPSLRLVDEGDGSRLVIPSRGEDLTERMRAWAEERVTALQRADLDGYVLKKDSPSCGMERVKVYRNGHTLHRKGTGQFADVLQERWPNLPVEEEGRLGDAALRENFIERVFCRNRWRALVRRGLSRGRLVRFLTAHKMLLRAHDEPAYRRIGRLVGEAGRSSDAELFAAFEGEFQRALRHRATVRRHVNVLQHALGYFKELLEPVEKRELLTAIEDYRQGLLPLVVPIALMRFQIRTHGVGYLADQLYFDPHPKELMLRNRV